MAIRLLTLDLHSSYLTESLVCLAFFFLSKQYFSRETCFSIFTHYLKTKNVFWHRQHGWCHQDFRQGHRSCCSVTWGKYLKMFWWLLPPPVGAAPPALQSQAGIHPAKGTRRAKFPPCTDWPAPALDMVGCYLGKFHVVPDHIYDIFLSYSCNGIEVMWGRGTETSCPFPAPVPHLLSHPH